MRRGLKQSAPSCAKLLAPSMALLIEQSAAGKEIILFALEDVVVVAIFMMSEMATDYEIITVRIFYKDVRERRRN